MRGFEAIRSIILSLSMTLLLHATASAQTWPARPIRMVVGFAAGGGTDVVARGLAPPLSEILGQPVVIENRPGANGAVGADTVAKSSPDGYTVHMGAAGTLVIAPHLGAQLPFDTFRDFAPVSLAATSPFIVAAHPSVKAVTVADLVALARSNPNKLTVGSSGNGGAPHLAAVLFNSMAGVDLVHVPYKGLAPAITDLIGGQIDLVFADVGLVRAHIASGKLRGLAVTGSRRLIDAPDLPTVGESGLPGYVSGTWYGVVAPAGTPAQIVNRLSAAIQRALASPELAASFASKGVEASSNSPEEFSALIRAENQKWGQVIRDAGVKAN